jgi:hypothetical protein
MSCNAMLCYAVQQHPWYCITQLSSYPAHGVLFASSRVCLQVGHVRRFFFIDTLLSRSTATGSDAATQAVVFPSQMSLLVQIQPDARNKIRPPLLTLK